MLVTMEKARKRKISNVHYEQADTENDAYSKNIEWPSMGVASQHENKHWNNKLHLSQ